MKSGEAGDKSLQQQIRPIGNLLVKVAKSGNFWPYLATVESPEIRGIRLLNPFIYRGLRLEAEEGIEPSNDGFANHCLTTWLLRHGAPAGAGLLRIPPVGVNARIEELSGKIRGGFLWGWTPRLMGVGENSASSGCIRLIAGVNLIWMVPRTEPTDEKA